MERDLAVTAAGDLEAPKPPDRPPVPATTGAVADALDAPVRTVHWLGRVWRARGFFGGPGAIALAAIGQYALVDRNDQSTALLYYEAAIVLLIASLLHPTLPRLPLLFKSRSANP